MKINGTGPGSSDAARNIGGSSGPQTIGGAKEKRNPGRTSRAEGDITEKVAISGKAKDAARAKEIAMSAPDTDESRIAKLKAVIDGGNYKIDADQIADRLVDEHLFNSI